MALPTKIVQIDGHRLSAHWNAAIQPTVRAMMVKILLITEKLLLQICGRQKVKFDPGTPGVQDTSITRSAWCG